MTSSEKTITLEETITLDKAITETLIEHPTLVKAIVTQWFESQGVVSVGGRSVEAKVAVSCVVEPRPEDKVLLCLSGKEVHILALLERPDKTEAKVTVPGAKNIHLHAQNTLQIAATDGGLYYDRLTLVSEKMSQASRELVVQAEDTIEVTKNKSETIHNRVINVSGVDVRRSHQVHEHIEETWITRARVYLSQIKEDVRMTAKRILFS